MVSTLQNPKPLVELYPYQRKFMADRARVLVGIWCRQAGKDFATAALAVDDAIETGEAWYIVSLTQRQADATFEKCKQWAEAWKQELKWAPTVSEAEYVEYDKMLDQAFHCTRRTLHLPGGGTVTSLPGRNPDTLAGLTGNVILTEFGLFPNGGYDHWRVIFPLITRGFRVVAISTPRGRNTKFYDLVSDPETYSVHTVDIHRAVADGLVLKDNNGEPTTIEAFQKLYGDVIGWAREFLLEFTGDLDALVAWGKLQAAASAHREIEFTDLRINGESGWRGDFFKRLAAVDGRLEIGWDVARRGDLSSLWVNAAARGRPRELAALVLMHDVSFALQRLIVTSAMDAHPRSVGCGDATGLGMDSNETLHTKYGRRWEPVTFTAAAKAELGSLLVTAFDDADQVLPDLDTYKYVALDIYGIQAERGGDRLRLVETGNPLLDDSHCDVGYSGALSRKAVGIRVAEPELLVL